MKRITIKELAERLGLSPSTVSRALAGDRNIRRETRERVSRLAGELGYRPNPVAVNLRSGRSNTVGVIVPEMVTPFAATVIGGIQRVLYGRGLKVIIAQSDENPQTECGNLELMERFMVDGVIACPCDATRNGEIYRRIRQRGVPLVFYDRAPLRVDASRVIVDDFATSYFLMEHLVRRGCRRIVHLGGPAHIPNARERLRGFRYALGKFGFVSDGRSVIPAGVTFDDGRAAADELLRRMPDADGLFAWTDTVAIGAMNRLRELGIRVPAQMAVAGYSGCLKGDGSCTSLRDYADGNGGCDRFLTPVFFVFCKGVVIVRNPLRNRELTGSEYILHIAVSIACCCDSCLRNDT